jgi:hypothetical protein
MTKNKPSERIRELAEKALSRSITPHFHSGGISVEFWVEAIIKYLDEEYDQK